MSFANVKERDYEMTRKKICLLLTNLYSHNYFLRESDLLTEKEWRFFDSVDPGMDDAPMLEAYVSGFWEELVAFTRSMFNAAFKTNPWLEKALMTGITRVSKESI